LIRNNKYASKIQKITSFSKKYNEKEVPDPYYGGSQGFEYVLDLLEDSCKQLLDKIKDELNNKNKIEETIGSKIKIPVLFQADV
jgi:protein-tyrosine phosphatase